MARQINENSSRQTVLARLNDMRANGEIESRGQAVAAIIAEFGISEAYAKTIYQTHREMLKTAGDLVETFEVKVAKSGELKLVSSFKDEAEAGDHEDVLSAVNAYRSVLAAQLAELDELVGLVNQPEIEVLTKVETEEEAVAA